MVARGRDGRAVAARPAGVPELRGRHLGTDRRRRPDAKGRARMATALDSIADVERELANQRLELMQDQQHIRTSVMTHIAWVPEPWVGAAENVLAGLRERHPSRTIVLLPEPDEDDGLEAEPSIDCFPAGHDRAICTETIRIHLRGNRVRAPASIVQPLLISDLPVFLRWRGEPQWESDEFSQLVGVADRLIVDSTEWDA